MDKDRESIKEKLRSEKKQDVELSKAAQTGTLTAEQQVIIHERKQFFPDLKKQRPNSGDLMVTQKSNPDNFPVPINDPTSQVEVASRMPAVDLTKPPQSYELADSGISPEILEEIDKWQKLKSLPHLNPFSKDYDYDAEKGRREQELAGIRERISPTVAFEAASIAYLRIRQLQQKPEFEVFPKRDTIASQIGAFIHKLDEIIESLKSLQLIEEGSDIHTQGEEWVKQYREKEKKGDLRAAKMAMSELQELALPPGSNPFQRRDPEVAAKIRTLEEIVRGARAKWKVTDEEIKNFVE